MAQRKVLAEFNAVDSMSKTLLRMEQNTGRWATGTLNAFGRVEKGMAGLLSSAGQLRILSGLVAGGFGVSMGAQFVDAAGRIRNSLREVGGASDAAFKEVYLASTRSLAEFETFAAGVQRFQKVLGDKQSFTESVRQLETLSKLMALVGKSTQERASTMLQFTQALQSGNLGGDELRALRESAPIELLRAIATEAGGTIESLKKMGEKGQLTTEVMVRALKTLESEADKRIGGVTVLISDAATQLKNGAIIATEGFDKGLGLSKAAVTGLQYLGQVLGENAEAAEMFGRAAQYAGGVLAAAFVGRNISGAVAGLSAYTNGLHASAAAAQAVVKAEELKLRSARSSVLLNTQILSGLTAENSSKRQVATATANLAKSQKIANAAALDYARASTIATAAQARLALGARLLAGSMAIARGAFAFLGGVPGILLIAGIALLTMSSNAETAADRMERLRGATDTAKTAGDSLLDAQTRLKEAMTATGDAGKEASDKIIAGTRQEILVKRELLKAQNDLAIAAEAERQIAIAEASRRAADASARLGGARNAVKIGGRAGAFAGQIPGLEEAVRAANLALAQLNADSNDAARTIAANFAMINDSINTMAHTARVDGEPAIQAMSKEAAKSVNYFQAQVAELESIAGLNKVIRLYGEDSAETAATRLAIARDEYLNMVETERVTGPYRDRLMEAWDAAKGVADADMAGTIAAALDPASGLAKLLRAAAAAWASIGVGKPVGGTTGAIASGSGTVTFGAGITSSPTPRSRPFELGVPDISTGSGGTGSSKGKDDLKEALRIIEGTLSAQEKQAKELAEMIALRDRLIATYGLESDIVQQMDTAIAKTKNEMSGLTAVTDSFFSTLSDHISSSIEDWKGWGDFVRSTLASLVSEWGPDFFTALFTPGADSGSSPGTSLGNALTGALVGSSSGGSSASRVSLSQGTVALPAGRSAASGVVVNNYNDFRGVDSSMKADLEGKLAQMERSFEGKVYLAIDKGRRNRRL